MASKIHHLSFTVALAMLVGCASVPTDETTEWSNEKLVAEAREETTAGNYERAIKLYEKLEGRAVGTLVSQQAQLERSYLLYKTNDKAQALVILERFIKLHPTSPALDYALYLQGLIHFNDNLGILGNFVKQDLAERDQQASRDSYQSLKQLAEQFPQSKYAPDAIIRMKYILNSLAAHEVHVARYYFMRGAYVAAANRAQQAIQEFPDSPSSEEALALLAGSYDRLGLAPLRDDAQRILQKNFPQSRFFSGEKITLQPSRSWKIW
ncbi:MAG: outer membrane protein assembly factor BamD [Burkholderiales bacterium]|jgi:outer membrane protein assembly factor BamD